MKQLLLPFLVFIAILYGCSSDEGTKSKSSVSGKLVVAGNGVVVSAHPESSGIGASILMKGGNAIDAAVATEFALAVCYPVAGNIGGGGFMLLRKNNGETDLVDYREMAPLKSSRDMYLDKDGKVIENASTDTHLASGVPGTVDGMLSMHSKYGSLPFRDVIQPSIDLANNGFKVTRLQAESLNEARAAFIERNVLPIPFVKDSLWKEGDTLIQKDLARTLEQIRDHGRDGFYGGVTAELIANEMKRGNGIIDKIDLSNYKSIFRKPLSANYKGHRIITVPPPSSGGVILIQLLGMIEPFSIENYQMHSVNAIHLMVEAERRAFADRSEFLGDPAYMKVPVEKLISTLYVRGRMKSFDINKASSSKDISPGSPMAEVSEETTHYSVVDSDGNAVSATTTLNGNYGSKIVVTGAGFLMNNQMDDFSIQPGYPNMYGLVGGEINSVQPGKRILSSMTPTIVEKDSNPYLIVGTPGGSTIPTSVFQVIVNVIDFGFDLKTAVDTGRFHHQWMPDRISLERNSFNDSLIQNLNRFGHNTAERGYIGSVNAIFIRPDGKRVGAADKRGDNFASGF